MIQLRKKEFILTFVTIKDKRKSTKLLEVKVFKFSFQSGKDTGSGINDYVTGLFDQTLSWKDIKWLK
jgi:hypothetical protein